MAFGASTAYFLKFTEDKNHPKTTCDVSSRKRGE